MQFRVALALTLQKKYLIVHLKGKMAPRVLGPAKSNQSCDFLMETKGSKTKFIKRLIRLNGLDFVVSCRHVLNQHGQH